MSFEKNALAALRSDINQLVVAGPGAGKTELLAQRAFYLLQTGLCWHPRRILAISFKRDAANNLRERVELRCGKELAARFDSLTYDAFAKSLLDRFREGLPHLYRPPANYDVASDNEGYSEMHRRIQEALRRLDPPLGLEGIEALRRFRAKDFAERHLYSRSIASHEQIADAVQWAAVHIWQELIAADKCIIPFDMVERLAAHVLICNPLLLKALTLTYSHVFLDEFQDTTGAQFDLLCSSFLGSSAIITAVGDNKQRIMLWAGAMKESFTAYEEAFDAARLPLFCNYRSDSELVRIQHFLVDTIDPQAGQTIASGVNDSGDGVCSILVFEDSNQEALYLANLIKGLLQEGVRPGDICLLSRIKPDAYCSKLLDELQHNGIKCRIEVAYQDLIRDELIAAVLAILRLASSKSSPESWETALQLSCLLAGGDPEDNSVMYMQEDRLSSFVSDMKGKMKVTINDVRGMKELVSTITKYYGHHALRSHFQQYRNASSFSRAMNRFCELLWASYASTGSWLQALDDFEGANSIPAMTVHKSKGLEYHTVIFIGLEDKAWINFAEQEEEHQCTFFVAFSRAKQRVYFTYCKLRPEQRNAVPLPQSRDRIASLYNMLLRAGVTEKQNVKNL
ncbi:MAG: ATP-dependent helicase [Armatimonadota bacterium]